jgi:hypothetical protein
MNAMRVSAACLLGLLIFCGRAATAGDAPAPAQAKDQPGGGPMVRGDDARLADWLARWEKNIVNDARNRYCDKAMGEDIGWLMTPFLDGFYYGYQATGDTKWIDFLVDWTDSWVKRGVREPDGYIGWPKLAAAGTKVDNLDDFTADSMLGEAMVLRPIVLMAGEIGKDPHLQAKYGAKAAAYLALAGQVYEKWKTRGAWRETEGGGAISLVLPFGIDPVTGTWTAGYETRNAPDQGFSHPNNKANHVARWLLAMSDVTGKADYKTLAEKWFRLLKSRLKPTDQGTYAIWNYWQPAGQWDYYGDGKTKHWVGTHPNGGYYSIDTAGIVDAYEHGVVFTKADIDRLVATALAEKRYWFALVPYSREIQEHFEAEHQPDTWGGLGSTPEYLARQARLRKTAP